MEKMFFFPVYWPELLQNGTIISRKLAQVKMLVAGTYHIPCSNLGHERDSHDWTFAHSPQANAGLTPKLGYDRLLLHIFQFTIR